MRVIVTASSGRLAGLDEALRALGHRVERHPLLATAPRPDPVAAAALG